VALTIFEDDECIHGLTLTTCVICKAPRGRQPAANRTSSYNDGCKTPENSHDYFGHPWPEWFAMCDAGAAYIRERALNGELVTYGELWEATERQMDKPIGNPWRQVPKFLMHISDREYERTGALLSALVVEDGPDGHPSEGFFRLAAARGFLAPEDAPIEGEPWTEMTPAQQRCWESQLESLGFGTSRPA
jgi:hypothetical protein